MTDQGSTKKRREQAMGKEVVSVEGEGKLGYKLLLLGPWFGVTKASILKHHRFDDIILAFEARRCRVRITR
jgi:hypothetical protein